MSKYKILFKISGSVSAYKACEVVSKLVQAGCEVRCVVTEAARHFVGDSTWEGLTGNPVFSNLFERGRQMDHIHLDRWADLVILCPATAHTLNRLAAGLADDPIGALFLAHSFKNTPYLIAPAMNTQMWEHPATQAAVQKLSTYGAQILPVASGALACGELGPGRLLEPSLIFDAILSALKPKRSNGQSILISGGATREPIDSVRFISNISSGKTASTLALAFANQGWEVCYLHGQSVDVNFKSTPDARNIRLREFSNTDDLSRIFQEELDHKEYQAIIHAAAVSDYTAGKVWINDTVTTHTHHPLPKISSGSKIKIVLAPTPKIVNGLKKFASRGTPKLVAFKLTDTSHLDSQNQAVFKLFEASGADWVIHNDLGQIDSGAEHEFHVFEKQKRDPNQPAEFTTVVGAPTLAQILMEKLK